jgi:hypothetical protein
MVFYYLFLFIFNTILTKVNLGGALNYAEQALSIAGDIKTLLTPEIKINEFLSNKEIDKRYEIILNDFLNKYSKKNKEYNKIDLRIKIYGGNILGINKKEDASLLNGFNDAYSKVKEAFKIYGIIELKGTKKTCINNKKRCRKYIYLDQLDNIIVSICKTLDIINTKRDKMQLQIEINRIGNEILQLLFDYQQEEMYLFEIINELEKSEKKISKISEQQKKIFNYINKNNDDDKTKSISKLNKETLYILFDSLCLSDLLIFYKNQLYIDKQEKFKNLLNQLKEMNKEINIIINKKNELISKEKLNMSCEYTFNNLINSDQNINKIVTQLVSILNGERPSYRP